MKFRTIKYYLKEGTRSLFKNHLMSVASIATISACIFIIILSYLIAVNLDYSLEFLEKTVGVTAFLNDNLSTDEITDLRSEIKSMNGVDDVKYISPGEALEQLKIQLDEYKDILEGLENDNPLSESFEISLTDPAYQSDIIRTLKQLHGIRKVSHAMETTETLINISNSIRIISLIIILILCFISVIIIMNTVKISVYVRKNEINIMKYVGATDWFIRWPFIIESLLIGLIGSTIPVLVSWAFYNKVIEIIYDKFTLIINVIQFKSATDVFYGLVPMTLIVGVLLGIIGSILSVRKYLRV